MTLGERQELFSGLYAKLILHIIESGYQVRLGDAFAIKRNPLEHKENSQHYLKQAGDVNLFKGGVWFKKTEDHAEFGAWWEKQHPLCRWGGRWGDGNHYELRP